MSEFFCELRAEEIPAGFLPGATAALAERLEAKLKEAELWNAETLLDVYDTPRRLIVRLRNLPAGIPEREVEVTGPPKKAAYGADGTPTKAALGFAAGQGVEAAALRVVATPKGEYIAVTKRQPGVGAAEILTQVVPGVLAALPWKKTMRWGEGKDNYVRPVHGLVALLDGQVVAMGLFGAESGRQTVGHRADGDPSIEVTSFDDYRQKLQNAGVVIDARERRGILDEKARQLAGEVGGKVHRDERLLDELCHLTEHPGLVRGEIRPEFLELPEEVLVTTVRHHQKSFVVETADGKIAPYFLAPMDHVGDPIGAIAKGNSWVVAARLSDARFFLAEDKKSKLADKAGKLERLAYHEKLGSYADKSARLEKLARAIAERLGRGELAGDAATAARLAKVDLVTEMVKEFTDLEGIVGGIYAQAEGASEAIWQAVYDHHRPKGESDALPRGDVGAIVALADKLDAIAGFFGLGLVPSGSKDPFGLRRAALGVMRILLERRWALDLDGAVGDALAAYGQRVKRSAAEVVADTAPFFADRLRFSLEARGCRYDEIGAVLASGPASLPDVLGRVEALGAFRESPDFRSLTLSFKRIVNILEKQCVAPGYSAEVFVEPAERELAAAFEATKVAADAALAAGRFREALEAISGLSRPLDRFFVDVMVMCDDEALRANRLGLLAALSKGFSRFAVFSEVVAERAA